MLVGFRGSFPVPSYRVTLGKCLNISGLLFPHLSKENKSGNCFIDVSSGLNNIPSIQGAETIPDHSKHVINMPSLY